MATFSDDIVSAVLHHMNDDHRDDSLLIARAFGSRDAETASMTGLDGDAGFFTYTIGDTGGGGAAADPARYFASASAATATTNVTLADAGRDFLSSPNTRGGSGQYTTVTMTTGGAASNITGTIIVVLSLVLIVVSVIVSGRAERKE